jgi:hypothetical protein
LGNFVELIQKLLEILCGAGHFTQAICFALHCTAPEGYRILAGLVDQCKKVTTGPSESGSAVFHLDAGTRGVDWSGGYSRNTLVCGGSQAVPLVTGLGCGINILERIQVQRLAVSNCPRRIIRWPSRRCAVPARRPSE